MSFDYSTFGHATQPDLGRISSYVISQMKEEKIVRPSQPGPAITVSYQTGAGEHEVSERLAQILQSGGPKRAVPWNIYNGNLVGKTLEEHHLPKNMAKFIPEDRRFVIGDLTDELLGLHPPEWVMVPKIAETVLHLANKGSAIFVGWGTSFITAQLPNVFHTRLVAPLPSRIERVAKARNLSLKAAARFVQNRDRGRRRYVKAYFNARRNDQMFHLIINTDLIPCDVAAELIAEQARKYFQKGVNGMHGSEGRGMLRA